VQPSRIALYQQAFALYDAAPGISRAVPVTNGLGTLQDQSGTLGCGSQAGHLANGLGLTAPCSLAFQTNTVNQTSEWLMSARLDQTLSNKQKLFLRFHTDHGIQPAFTDPISHVFDVTSSQPEYEGQVDHTYLVSPRLVNHFIGSASWYSQLFGPTSMKTALSTFPTYWQFVGTGGANGSGNAFTALGLLTPNVPQGRRDGQGQIIDDLSRHGQPHAEIRCQLQEKPAHRSFLGKADRGRGVYFLLRSGVCLRGIGLWLQLLRTTL
jgi:hypothetical protein